MTRALDIESGKLLWQVAGAGEVRYSPALDLVVTSQGIHRAQDGSVVAALPDPPKPNPLVKNPPIQYPAHHDTVPATTAGRLVELLPNHDTIGVLHGQGKR